MISGVHQQNQQGPIQIISEVEDRFNVCHSLSTIDPSSANSLTVRGGSTATDPS